MGSTRGSLSVMAAVALGIGVLVILVTPGLLDAPNPLAGPSALVVAVGAVGAALGGRTGRRVGVAVSVAGLVLAGLWLALASNGFGLGPAWIDDMAEAAILASLFAVATSLLVLSEGALDRARVARWTATSGAVIVLSGAAVALAVQADQLPPIGS